MPVNWTRERVSQTWLAPILIGWTWSSVGDVRFWKGAAAWHFITVPQEECGELEACSALVTYGWGMIPVTAQIGGTGWKASLFPKDGRSIVPVKAWAQEAEGLEVGDMATVRLAVEI